MASNPLMDKAPTKRGKVTPDMLHDLAASLNSEPFVRGMGRFYRVGVEMKDGEKKHFLTWDTVLPGGRNGA